MELDVCAVCGHAWAFHRTAEGTGRLPAGTKYCDDRHSRPCSCTGFVRRTGISGLLDDMPPSRMMSAVLERAHASVTPIRHVAVLTMISPDDWRTALGSVAAQLPLRLHYSDVWPMMVDELRRRAMDQWPGVTLLCNMQLSEHVSQDGMEHWVATADAYGAAEDG